MKKILIIGSTGQIGSELSIHLRALYGTDNVICGYYTPPYPDHFFESGPTEKIDATQAQEIADVVKKHKPDTIYNLAAILSATAERNPQLGWDVGINSLLNCLNVSKEYGCAVFTPSSIGAFGPGTPKEQTPQDTIQRPTTMYGITKVTGELLSDYYHERWGVDARSVRYPGIISSYMLPGGGTTDYAVEIFHKAVLGEKYLSPLKPGTFMDMMYMPDALDAAIHLMEADPAGLKHRNSFNVTSMSLDPDILFHSIQKHFPDFEIEYEIDPVKQAIADSWPDSLDDSCAREEWGWKPNFGLEEMTRDMISTLSEKYGKKIKPVY